eukprot:1161821-Pelagomonas_calceolata.AAC.7
MSEAKTLMPAAPSAPICRQQRLSAVQGPAPMPVVNVRGQNAHACCSLCPYLCACSSASNGRVLFKVPGQEAALDGPQARQVVSRKTKERVTKRVVSRKGKERVTKQVVSRKRKGYKVGCVKERKGKGYKAGRVKEKKGKGYKAGCVKERQGLQSRLCNSCHTCDHVCAQCVVHSLCRAGCATPGTLAPAKPAPRLCQGKARVAEQARPGVKLTDPPPPPGLAPAKPAPRPPPTVQFQAAGTGQPLLHKYVHAT